MASILDQLKHPARTLRNAQFKAGLAARAFRREFGKVEPWVDARNKRLEIVNYGPAHIFIEPTNACNLRCPMCPTGAGQQTRKAGIIDPALVQKIISEIKHQPKQFAFWLAGEPMLHPQIVDMVGMAARAGLQPAMHSNATKLTRKTAEGLIKSGLHWLSFSFDGDNAEDYEHYRKPAKYDDTIERIKMFLRVREELQSKTPYVVVQTLVPYEGPEIHPAGTIPDAKDSFTAQFSDVHVDEFRSYVMHAWSGQMEGHENVAPNVKDTGIRWVCDIPFRDMSITWNGDVVSCCGDLDAQNIIDNVRDKNIYDVWNGEGFQRFRRAMVTDEIEKWPLCGSCERIWTAKPHQLDYRLKMEMLRFKLGF